MEHLTEEEKAKVGLLADAITDIIARRYGLQPTEVVEAVRWVHAHKEFVSRMKHAGWMSLFGIMLSAMMLSVWEGAKALIRRTGG